MSTSPFTNAHVLITGGTSGIGLALARHYHAAKANVHITGTRARPTDYEPDLSPFTYHQMSLEDNKQIDALASATPQLDILINNAGSSFTAQGLDECDPDIFARTLQIHLTGGYRLAHALTDKLAQSQLTGGGSILSIASLTSFMGVPMTRAYGTAKTGLLGLVRNMAVELGARNIRVNAVAAGLTQTGMTEAVFTQEEWLAPVLARTPLGRLGQPDDIAGAVLFMTSPQAAWITGQVLTVDGGYTICG